MKTAKALLAILRGEAVVLIRKDDRNADVVVGRNIHKRFAINSMVGALKAMML